MNGPGIKPTSHVELDILIVVQRQMSPSTPLMLTWITTRLTDPCSLSLKLTLFVVVVLSLGNIDVHKRAIN